MKEEEIIMSKFIMVKVERSKQVQTHLEYWKEDMLVKINNISSVTYYADNEKTYINLHTGGVLCVPDYSVKDIYDMISEAESNNSMNSRMDALEKKVDKLTGLLEKR